MTPLDVALPALNPNSESHISSTSERTVNWVLNQEPSSSSSYFSTVEDPLHGGLGLCPSEPIGVDVNKQAGGREDQPDHESTVSRPSSYVGDNTEFMGEVVNTQTTRRKRERSPDFYDEDERACKLPYRILHSQRLVLKYLSLRH